MDESKDNSDTNSLPWLWSKECSVPSNMDAAHGLIDEVTKQAENSGWNGKEVFAINLALEEALVNAIQHGNRQDPNKYVHFICRLNNEKIYVRIEDEGDGFNPAALPDPTDAEHLMVASGRGCLLIKGFASRVRWNEKGNVIEFEKDKAAQV